MKPFHAEVGRRPFVVHIEERPGRKNLWLRWWNRATDNWERQPTDLHPRDEHGTWVMTDSQAIAIAEEKQRQLKGGESPVVTGDHLTIAQGLERAIDPDTGLYPTDTPHRREVIRSVQFAMTVLRKPWVAIASRDVQHLWRAKIREMQKAGHHGHRQAEITTSRLLTVANWLRSNNDIPAGACPTPHKWRKMLRADWRQLTGAIKDPEPNRPRHTLAEAQKILHGSEASDPRFHLMLWLAMELRLGQVSRCRRSDLDLEAGTFTVHGSGFKRGADVVLTKGMKAVALHHLSGYLAPLEALGRDYPLFPRGQLKGGRTGTPQCRPTHADAKPVGRTVLRKWYRETCRRVDVALIPGRALYGVRRVSTDAAIAAELDEEALKRFGGWSDSQMPRQVYKDKQDAKADQRATTVRASIRGEARIRSRTQQNRKAKAK